MAKQVSDQALASTTSAGQKSRGPVFVSVAMSFGVMLEFYDFFLFGYLAFVLGNLFFPTSNPITSLMLAFVSFAVGYFFRPLGALLFGHMGDKIGRKNTTILTITLMGIASLLTGLLPPYASIGLAAPLLISIFRILQGLSLGGEQGGTYNMVAESVPPGKRGFYMGLIAAASIPFQAIIGLLLLYAMQGLFPGQAFLDIGWRILFFIGAGIALVGFLIRQGVSESPVFKKMAEGRKTVKLPMAEAFHHNWKQILQVIGVIAGQTGLVYISTVFAVSYLITVIKIPAALVTLSLSIGYLSYAVLAMPFGYLSDKIGRRTCLLIGAVGMILFIYPYFVLLSTGLFLSIILAQLIMGVFQAMYGASWSVFATEVFPARVRYTGMAFSNAVATSVFGGTTPLIATFLIVATGYQLAPVFWEIALLTVSIISVLTAIETKGIDMNY